MAMNRSHSPHREIALSLSLHPCGGRPFQRSSLLNVSGEKGNNSTGDNDGQGEPDDAPKWPAKPVLLPHGDQRQGNENYAEKYNQQMT